MTVNDLETGLFTFVDTYVIPNLNNSMDKWLLYFGLGEGGVQLETMLAEYKPMLASLGILCKDGNIDLDAMEKNGKAAFKKQPKLKIWKLVFTDSDFDSLMSHLRNTQTKPLEVTSKVTI